jgi:hypothetical protein
MALDLPQNVFADGIAGFDGEVVHFTPGLMRVDLP